MCGRFALVESTERINNYFEINNNLAITSRYNIAPSQPILVIRQFLDQAPEFAHLRWGLIPFWMKAESLHAGWINARTETVAEKPAFKQAFKYRRCLIVASGFYEWKSSLVGNKLPYYLYDQNNTLLAMAGIWERWQGEKDQVIESCAILTRQAVGAVKTIHSRMPVLLRKDHFQQWLNPYLQDTTILLALLKSDNNSNIEAYRVGQQVNSPIYDESDCITPVKLTVKRSIRK